MTSLANRCIAHITCCAACEQGDGPGVPSAPAGQVPGREEGPACAPLPGHCCLPRAVPCPGEPETPATAASARRPFPIQALAGYFYTYQASYACQWRGVGRGPALQRGAARGVKVPLGGMPCTHGLLSYPLACLSML